MEHTAAGASDMVKAIDGVFAQVELGLEARVKALVRHQENFEGRGTLEHRASDVLVGLAPDEGLHIDKLLVLEQRMTPSWPISHHMMMGWTGAVVTNLKPSSNLPNSSVVHCSLSQGAIPRPLLEVKVTNDYRRGRGMEADQVS